MPKVPYGPPSEGWFGSTADHSYEVASGTEKVASPVLAEGRGVRGGKVMLGAVRALMRMDLTAAVGDRDAYQRIAELGRQRAAEQRGHLVVVEIGPGERARAGCERERRHVHGRGQGHVLPAAHQGRGEVAEAMSNAGASLSTAGTLVTVSSTGGFFDTLGHAG